VIGDIPMEMEGQLQLINLDFISFVDECSNITAM